MIRSFSNYKYRVFKGESGWVYAIYKPSNPDCYTVDVKSEFSFNSEERANLAAIGHISLLEKEEC